MVPDLPACLWQLIADLIASALAREVVECAAAGATLEEHREALERSGELRARRREQARAWMWSLVEEQLLESFRSHAGVRDLVGGIERDVESLLTTPAAGARALLERFRSG